MRFKLIYLLLLLIMVNVSCTEYKKEDTHKAFQPFLWKIGSRLPDNPDGSPAAGLAGPVAGISNDHLMIGGGSNFPDKAPWEGGQKKYYRQLYIYTKKGDSIELVHTADTVSLPYNIAYSANCSTTRGLVVAGGENETGQLNKVLLLTWEEKEQKLRIKELPELPASLTAGMLTSIGSSLYFAGGNTTNETSSGFFKLNLDSLPQGWQELASLPQPTAYGVLFGLEKQGKLYLAGGRRSNPSIPSDLYNQLYQFDLASNQWTERSSLPYALSAETGVVFDPGTLLIFSGDKGEVFHQTEVLLFRIATEKDPQKKAALIRQKNKLQVGHPGFSGAVLAYRVSEDSWQQVDTIPFPGQVTTSAFLWGNQVIIPCGEIRAGVRSAAIVTGEFD